LLPAPFDNRITDALPPVHPKLSRHAGVRRGPRHALRVLG
jgi:hypothetical protein